MPDKWVRAMSGWIRLYRGWRNCEVFSQEPASEREAWLHLIEMAAWKGMHRTAGKGDVVFVGRGQLHTAERTLADMWSWDRKRVKRFLSRLEKCSMISRETGPSGNLITVCNYDSFQGDGADHGTDNGTIAGPIEDHRGTTQRKGKKGKEGKEGKNKGSFELPEWVCPTSWAQWEEHRKQIKAPLTDLSRSRCVGVLEEAIAKGYSVQETIDLAIVSGWQGLFVPKNKRKSAAPTQPDVLRRLTAEAKRSAGGDA